MTQFVTEAVLMSLIGALTGVVFGVVASYLVARFYQPTIVSVQSIFIAVGLRGGDGAVLRGLSGAAGSEPQAD